MNPIPDDDTSDVTSEFVIHGTEPDLYPIYSMADSVKKRNEFVYRFPDNQFKLVLGPVNRSGGWVWRVEPHPEPNDDISTFYSTFKMAFETAEDLASDCLPDDIQTNDGESLD